MNERLLTPEAIDLICEAHRQVDLPDDIVTHICKAQDAKSYAAGRADERKALIECLEEHNKAPANGFHWTYLLLEPRDWLAFQEGK